MTLNLESLILNTTEIILYNIGNRADINPYATAVFLGSDKE
nr:hypothetical protein [Clostridium thermobutyricum]